MSDHLRLSKDQPLVRRWDLSAYGEEWPYLQAKFVGVSVSYSSAFDTYQLCAYTAELKIAPYLESKMIRDPLSASRGFDEYWRELTHYVLWLNELDRTPTFWQLEPNSTGPSQE